MAGWAVVSHLLAGWGVPVPFPDLAGTATVSTFTGSASASNNQSAATVPGTAAPAAVPAFAGAAAGGTVPSGATVPALAATVSTLGVST